jgi:hypothetical protein
MISKPYLQVLEMIGRDAVPILAPPPLAVVVLAKRLPLRIETRIDEDEAEAEAEADGDGHAVNLDWPFPQGNILFLWHIIQQHSGKRPLLLFLLSPLLVSKRVDSFLLHIF